MVIVSDVVSDPKEVSGSSRYTTISLIAYSAKFGHGGCRAFYKLKGINFAGSNSSQIMDRGMHSDLNNQLRRWQI